MSDLQQPRHISTPPSFTWVIGRSPLKLSEDIER